MVIYTETTPNPSALKFIVDRVLLSQGVSDFPNAAAAENQSKLATKFFQYPFVNGVFIGRNFVTITKTNDARWEDVIPAIKETFKLYLESGEKVVENEENIHQIASDDDIVKKIVQIIDEQVRPAVAMDGGDIIFEGFEEGVVKLKMRGSCSGCPSSTVTLKSGIQSMLTRLFPDVVKSVEAV